MENNILNSSGLLRIIQYQESLGGDEMINFIIELVQWIKARKYRKRILGKPYFFGEPGSVRGKDRLIAFRIATGEMTQEEARQRTISQGWNI